MAQEGRVTVDGRRSEILKPQKPKQLISGHVAEQTQKLKPRKRIQRKCYTGMIGKIQGREREGNREETGGAGARLSD